MDAYVSTGQGLSGDNMFAYCLNNPIIRGDVDGEASITVIAGAIVGGFYGAMSALATKEASIGSVLVSTAVGAVTGAFNAWIWCDGGCH